MRRALVSLALCFFVLAPLSSAAAQTRDPFVPLVTEDLGGGVVDPAPAPVSVADVPEPAPDYEVMATTGFPVSQFVGLALALIGGGLLITWSARMARPVSG